MQTFSCPEAGQQSQIKTIQDTATKRSTPRPRSGGNGPSHEGGSLGVRAAGCGWKQPRGQQGRQAPCGAGEAGQGEKGVS